MAINIEIVTDVAGAVAGVGTLADRYDAVSDTLKDVARAGESAGKDLERGLEAGADEAKDLARAAGKAEKATDELGDAGKSAGKDLERGLKDGEEAAKDLDRKADAAFDAISESARTSGKAVGKAQEDGFRQAGEGAETFAEEADSNAREVAASFDGSAESILDGFQGLAAEALAGFGPAGMIAGLALAAGIGIAVTKMQDLAEENDVAQEAAVSLAAAFEEAGGRIEDVDIPGIIREWGREVQGDNWITFWADESITNFQDAAKTAREAGVDVKDAIKGMKGTAEDSQGFLDGTNAEWERLTKVIAAGTRESARGGKILSDTAKDALTKRDALDELRKGSQDNLDVTSEAIEIYGIEKDVLGDVAQSADEAADAIKGKADASAAAAGAAMDVVGAENDWIVTSAQLTKDIAANGASLDANTEAGRANRASLVDLAGSANSYRDAAIGAGQSTEMVTANVQASRDAFIAAAEAAGYDATKAAELADSYGLIPGNVETQVAAYGTDEAKAAIESIPDATDTTVNVTEAGTGETQAAIDGVAGKEVTVQTTEEGAAGAQKTIDAVKGKEVAIDVTDKGTAAKVQTAVNGIKGGTVGVSVSLTNLAIIQEELRQLTLPRTAYVDVVQRSGKAVN